MKFLPSQFAYLLGTRENRANLGALAKYLAFLVGLVALYAGVFHRRHPTLLTPRDFDLSPYFDIVKFNVIEDRAFDYLRIAWADDIQGDRGGE